MCSIWKRPFILQNQRHWNQWSHWYVYCIARWHKINVIWGFRISCWMSLLVQLLDNLLRFPLGFFLSGCVVCFKWFSYRALHTIGATVWLQRALLWLRVARWTTRANLSLAFPHKRLSLWLLKQWTTTRSLRSGRLWKQCHVAPSFNLSEMAVFACKPQLNWCPAGLSPRPQSFGTDTDVVRINFVQTGVAAKYLYSFLHSTCFK